MAGPSTPSVEAICYECGEAGHTARLCPPKQQAGRGACFTCGQTGHYCYTCPVPYCASCDKHHQQKDCPRTNMACIRCGEKGHRSDQCEANCPNCEEDHPPGECPMRLVTCFICESKDHCPANCPFRATLAVVIQQQQEILRSALKTKVDEKDETRTSLISTSARPADRDIPETPTKPNKGVKCFKCQHIGHFASRCPRKNQAVTASEDPREMRLLSMNQAEGCSLRQNKDLPKEQTKIFKCVKVNHPGIVEVQQTPSIVMGAFGADTNSATVLIDPEAPHSVIRKDETRTSPNSLSSQPAGCDPRTPSESKKVIRCFRCLHIGHYANRCPSKNQVLTANPDSRGLQHVDMNQAQGSAVRQNKDLPKEQTRIFKCGKVNYLGIVEAQQTPSVVMGAFGADTNPATVLVDSEATRSIIRKDETRTSPNSLSAHSAGCDIPETRTEPNKGVKCFRCQHIGHYANRCPSKKQVLTANPDSQHVDMNQAQGSAVWQNKDLPKEQPRNFGCRKVNYPGIAEAQQTPSVVTGAFGADTNPATVLIDPEATHSIIRKDEIRTSPNSLSAHSAGCDIPETRTELYKGVKCFRCQHIGHYANRCPSKKQVLTANPDSQHVDMNQAQGSAVWQNKDLPKEQPRNFGCRKVNYPGIAEAQQTASVVTGAFGADTNPATVRIDPEATHSIIRKDETRTSPNSLSARPTGCDIPETPTEPNKGAKCFKCQHIGHFARHCPTKNKVLMANPVSQHVDMNKAQGSAVLQNKDVPKEEARIFECGKFNYLAIVEAQRTPSVVTGPFCVDTNPATALIDPEATHSLIRKNETRISSNSLSAHPDGCDIPETPSKLKKVVRCYRCQRIGHFACHCPSKNALMENPVFPGMWHVGMNQAQGSAVWQNKDLPEEQAIIFECGKVNYLTIAEAQRTPSIVMGTFYADTNPATVVIDPEATHSIIAKSFVTQHEMAISLLDEPTKIKLPGVVICTELGCPGVKINMDGLNLTADLVVLDVHGIDVILGANWLNKNQGRINYERRSVFLDNGSGTQVEVIPQLKYQIMLDVHGIDVIPEAGSTTRCTKRPRRSYGGMTLRHKKTRI